LQLAKRDLERLVGFGASIFDGVRAEGGDQPWSDYWTAIGFRVFVPDSTDESTKPENRLSLRYTFRHDASGAVSEYRVYGDVIDALRYGNNHLATDFGPELQFHFWELLESDPRARHAGEHWVNADVP
jgi:hypothetical protein